MIWLKQFWLLTEEPLDLRSLTCHIPTSAIGPCPVDRENIGQPGMVVCAELNFPSSYKGISNGCGIACLQSGQLNSQEARGESGVPHFQSCLQVIDCSGVVITFNALIETSLEI